MPSLRKKKGNRISRSRSRSRLPLTTTFSVKNKNTADNNKSVSGNLSKPQSYCTNEDCSDFRLCYAMLKIYNLYTEDYSEFQKNYYEWVNKQEVKQEVKQESRYQDLKHLVDFCQIVHPDIFPLFVQYAKEVEKFENYRKEWESIAGKDKDSKDPDVFARDPNIIYTNRVNLFKDRFIKEVEADPNLPEIVLKLVPNLEQVLDNIVKDSASASWKQIKDPADLKTNCIVVRIDKSTSTTYYRRNGTFQYYKVQPGKLRILGLYYYTKDLLEDTKLIKQVLPYYYPTMSLP